MTLKQLKNQHLRLACFQIKGIQSFADKYVENFRLKNINGKKLSTLDMSDLGELIGGSNLNHQLVIFKSINNLIQLVFLFLEIPILVYFQRIYFIFIFCYKKKYDLQKDTLHNLIFITLNHITGICKYIERINLLTSMGDVDACVKLKHDLIKNSAYFATIYRKLITWLVRLPFTKLKAFEKFRDELNFEMKMFFKLFRKKLNENAYDEMKQIVIFFCLFQEFIS